MKGLWIGLILILALPGTGGAFETPEVTLRYQGYSTPTNQGMLILKELIGRIPTDTGKNLETERGKIPIAQAINNFRLDGLMFADYITRNQERYYWYRAVFIPRDSKDVYNGQLNRLGIVLKDGSVRRVQQIMTSPISPNKGSDVPMYFLTANGERRTYEEYAIETSGSGKTWYLFLAFEKDYRPGDEEDLILLDPQSALSAP